MVPAGLERFSDFLEEHGSSLQTELFIPTVVGNLVESKQVKVKVLPTHDKWFGITYREDRDIAERSIAALVAEGRYPRKLWEK